MNTDKSTPLPAVPSVQPATEVTNQQLMAKLQELDKKIELIIKKLSTPLIN